MYFGFSLLFQDKLIMIIKHVLLVSVQLSVCLAFDTGHIRSSAVKRGS